jgi:hypothetical protein
MSLYLREQKFQISQFLDLPTNIAVKKSLYCATT